MDSGYHGCMPLPLDLDLTRDALATSTLSHGLKLLGDRWSMAILMGAFLGVRRFDQWQTRLGIPRHTLAERLKTLVGLDLLRPRLYQERPARHAYHLTRKGMALYDQVLMIWDWERCWGSRKKVLPRRLTHRLCGHSFTPDLACTACHQTVLLGALRFRLQPNPNLPFETAAPGPTPRISLSGTAGMELGLRVDRWALLIIASVVLGCHYFDQLTHVLGIGPSVLARRLQQMVVSSLLLCEVDRVDARRRIYRLTAASRALFGYIVCLSSWAGQHHFHESRSILASHQGCGQVFVPQAVCSHCRMPLKPWDVHFEEEGLSAAAAPGCVAERDGG